MFLFFFHHQGGHLKIYRQNFKGLICSSIEKRTKKMVIIGVEQLFARVKILHFQIAHVLPHVKFLMRFCQFRKSVSNTLCSSESNISIMLHLKTF